MPEPTGAEQVRSLLGGHARARLDALLAAGATPRPGSAVVAEGGWTVRVSVTPSPADPGEAPRLSECERDCLELLLQLHEPMSAAAASSRPKPRQPACMATRSAASLKVVSRATTSTPGSWRRAQALSLPELQGSSTRRGIRGPPSSMLWIPTRLISRVASQ
jgi:hypothetical protein